MQSTTPPAIEMEGWSENSMPAVVPAGLNVLRDKAAKCRRRETIRAAVCNTDSYRAIQLRAIELHQQDKCALKALVRALREERPLHEHWKEILEILSSRSDWEAMSRNWYSDVVYHLIPGVVFSPGGDRTSPEYKQHNTSPIPHRAGWINPRDNPAAAARKRPRRDRSVSSPAPTTIKRERLEPADYFRAPGVCDDPETGCRSLAARVADVAPHTVLST